MPAPRRVAATTGARSPPGTSVADTSRRTGWSTSSATTRTGCRPRSRTSSTTRTGPLGRPAALRRREKRYIIAPAGLDQGTAVEAGERADIKPGNNLPLRNIPVGTTVHAVELRPGGGAKLGRSAGASIQLVAREGKNATLRMPSGEMRRSTSAAAPRSAGSATPSSPTSTGARPAATAGRASARPYAAWQ